jgi:hypothetical protein
MKNIYPSMNLKLHFYTQKKVNRVEEEDWKDFEEDHLDLNEFEDLYGEFTEGEQFPLDEESSGDEEYYVIESSDNDQESDDDAENLWDD